ncbi:MAG TPA: acyl-CoA dehydrogenase [Steroidobacteraceae bacterium]|nr:acyl-CoA dehydrogenase [Steroidobacteraceae bacterium]
MPTRYDAPLALMRVALAQAARVSGLSALPDFNELLAELSGTALEGAARVARDVLSPLNGVGDATGSRLTPDGVLTPAGFRDAYGLFCEGGWPALAAPAEFGGQGLPTLFGAAATEMWAGANLSFAMCIESAVGAVETLRHHAPDGLRASYLPQLVSGEWTASMCLTEPQAGSDLSTLRTSATPEGEHWRLRGRKIFISWGDHDLSANIVHLVLARAAGAPAGSKGISLFLVPKLQRNGDGSLSANDVRAVSLEHKMGIRASPTCVMSFGEREGARGWLIGPLNEGLRCMFTMMNHMRLGVGLHSTGLAQRAWQLAREYAQERLQGRDAAGAQRPIIEHEDVRRMLLGMKALTHACRCLAYTAAALLDVASIATDTALRARAQARLGLLTPLVKAWCSDCAVEVASLGVQIHGGLGYIDECEASQIYRDARIGPIFEGTNYIQAQDLLVRKIIREDGTAFEELLVQMEQDARALDTVAGLASLSEGLRAECAELRGSTRELIRTSGTEAQLARCVAYPFLQWLGVVAGAWQWALTAREAAATASDPAARALLDCARFYAQQLLPRARAFARIVANGADPVLAPRLGEL